MDFFKQFFVAHDRCAMKVGTDGILLGAWAPVAGVKRCLDIGAGSGLLALMLAQRTSDSVIIDAVELESEAAAQAQENMTVARGQSGLTSIRPGGYSAVDHTADSTLRFNHQ